MEPWLKTHQVNVLQVTHQEMNNLTHNWALHYKYDELGGEIGPGDISISEYILALLPYLSNVCDLIRVYYEEHAGSPPEWEAEEFEYIVYRSAVFFAQQHADIMLSEIGPNAGLSVPRKLLDEALAQAVRDVAEGRK